MKQLLLVLLAIFLSTHQKCLGAAEPNLSAGSSADVTPCSQNVRQKSSGGYCGVYCLYAAMKYFGVTIDPNELVKPEYIGSAKGSSLAELKKAAEKHGLYAVPIDRMTTKDLRGLSLPLLIHVKSSPTGKKYGHYFLFLGSKEGQALIYDPPNPVESVDFWTLAPRWDGSGLLISDKPINLNTVFASSCLRFAGLAVVSAVIVVATRRALARFHNPKPVMLRKRAIVLSFAQCAILVLSAASVAFIYHSSNDEGLLLRKQAAKNIQKAYQSAFASKSKVNKSQLTGSVK